MSDDADDTTIAKPSTTTAASNASAPKPRPESSAQKMRRSRAKEDLIATLSEDLVDTGFLKENEVEDFDAIKRAMRQVIERIQDVTAKNSV